MLKGTNKGEPGSDNGVRKDLVSMFRKSCEAELQDEEVDANQMCQKP